MVDDCFCGCPEPPHVGTCLCPCHTTSKEISWNPNLIVNLGEKGYEKRVIGIAVNGPVHQGEFAAAVVGKSITMPCGWALTITNVGPLTKDKKRIYCPCGDSNHLLLERTWTTPYDTSDEREQPRHSD